VCRAAKKGLLFGQGMDKCPRQRGLLSLVILSETKNLIRQEEILHSVQDDKRAELYKVKMTSMNK
jgi:hypothetical protein